jgi:hypothetical protein
VVWKALLTATGTGWWRWSELASYVEDEVPRVTLRLFNYEQFPMHDARDRTSRSAASPLAEDDPQAGLLGIAVDAAA